MSLLALSTTPPGASSSSPDRSPEDWFDTDVQKQLTPQAREYLVGRAATPEDFDLLGFFVWDATTPKSPCPCGMFSQKFGPYGQSLHGKLITPFTTPRGKNVGFQARSLTEKAHYKWDFPTGAWNPLYSGLHPVSFDKIITGGSVWLVEGVFDLLALQRVVPATHVVLSCNRAGITHAQAEFLRRWVNPFGGSVYLCFDNDEAGREATHGKPPDKRGAIPYLKKIGVDRVYEYKYIGKDPGEVWKTGGMKGMLKAFRNMPLF